MSSKEPAKNVTPLEQSDNSPQNRFQSQLGNNPYHLNKDDITRDELQELYVPLEQEPMRVFAPGMAISNLADRVPEGLRKAIDDMSSSEPQSMFLNASSAMSGGDAESPRTMTEEELDTARYIIYRCIEGALSRISCLQGYAESFPKLTKEIAESMPVWPMRHYLDKRARLAEADRVEALHAGSSSPGGKRNRQEPAAVWAASIKRCIDRNIEIADSLREMDVAEGSLTVSSLPEWVNECRTHSAGAMDADSFAHLARVILYALEPSIIDRPEFEDYVKNIKNSGLTDGSVRSKLISRITDPLRRMSS